MVPWQLGERLVGQWLGKRLPRYAPSLFFFNSQLLMSSIIFNHMGALFLMHVFGHLKTRG
jgi:hypothetical protein